MPHKLNRRAKKQPEKPNSQSRFNSKLFARIIALAAPEEDTVSRYTINGVWLKDDVARVTDGHLAARILLPSPIEGQILRHTWQRRATALEWTENGLGASVPAQPLAEVRNLPNVDSLYEQELAWPRQHALLDPRAMKAVAELAIAAGWKVVDMAVPLPTEGDKHLSHPLLFTRSQGMSENPPEIEQAQLVAAVFGEAGNDRNPGVIKRAINRSAQAEAEDKLHWRDQHRAMVKTADDSLRARIQELARTCRRVNAGPDYVLVQQQPQRH